MSHDPKPDPHRVKRATHDPEGSVWGAVAVALRRGEVGGGGDLLREALDVWKAEKHAAKLKRRAEIHGGDERQGGGKSVSGGAEG